MKKGVVGLVSVAALSILTAGMAGLEDFLNNSASRVFFSGNLGYGYVNSNNVARKHRHGFVYALSVGYQFNQYFALEIGYIQFNGCSVQVGSGLQSNGTHRSADLSAYDLLAKGIVPISQQFNLFAKAGVARMEANIYQRYVDGTGTISANTYTTVPMLGAGAAYNVNKNVAVTLQGLYTVDDYFTRTISGTKVKLKMPYTISLLLGATYKFAV